MSSFFLIYIDENTSFDSDKVKKAIISLDNAQLAISEHKYSEGRIEYGLDPESVNINIGKNWKFMAIEGGGDIALQFAIEFNKLSDNNLYLTDSSYSFLCQLNGVNSIEQLERIMVEGNFV